MVLLILVNARRETRDAHNLNFSFHSLFLKLYYVYLLSIRLLNRFSTLSKSNFIISFYKFFNSVIGVYFNLFNLNAYYKKYFILGGYNPMKKFLTILFFAMISSQIFGYYGGIGGRGFIDFLVDRDQLRIRVSHMGFHAGTDNVKVAFGFAGNTGGILLGNFTNNGSTDNKLASYFSPSVALAVGYKSDLISVAGAYNYQYYDKNYGVHTPAFMLTALENTFRISIPVSIGVGANELKNTLAVSTIIEARYYLRTWLNHFRLYLLYGNSKDASNPDNKNVYEKKESFGFDARAYFFHDTGRGLTIWPYLRVAYDTALKSENNDGTTKTKTDGDNFSVTAYKNAARGELAGGYIASLAGGGAASFKNPYRVGITLPVMFVAASDYVSLTLEPSLSVTIIGGKEINISNNNTHFATKKGQYYTLGYVMYGEIFLTPIPELELFLSLQAGGATRWGVNAANNGSIGNIVFGADSGISWYF